MVTTNNSRFTADDRNLDVLPKTSVEGRIKEALIKLLHLPGRAVHDAEIVIVRDGKHLEVLVKSEISKLRQDIDNLLHHKHYSRDAVNDAEGTRTITFAVPREIESTVLSIANTKLSEDEKLLEIEKKLKELNLTEKR